MAKVSAEEPPAAELDEKPKKEKDKDAGGAADRASKPQARARMGEMEEAEDAAGDSERPPKQLGGKLAAEAAKVVTPNWAGAKEISWATAERQWQLRAAAPGERPAAERPAAGKPRRIPTPRKIDHSQQLKGMAINSVCHRWDAATAQPLAYLNAKKGLKPALSPDRKYLAVASDKDLGILDPATGKLIAVRPTPEKRGLEALAFTPSGARLACVLTGKVFMIDVATGDLGAAVCPHGNPSRRHDPAASHVTLDRTEAKGRQFRTPLRREGSSSRGA